MKKIEAVIRPEKFEEVKEGLMEIGCPGMMVTDIKGHGQQKGIELEWRVGTYKVDMLPKIKIEIIADEQKFQEIVDTILNYAATGEVGDGKIFIYPVEEVVRIRTRETGKIAI